MYTVKTAAEAAGVTIPTVYNYTKRFTRFFSPGATPQKGTTRLFSSEDIRLLAYLHHKLVQQKLTYEQVEQQLTQDTGELMNFTAYTAPASPQSEEQGQPVQRAELLAAKVLVEDARLREQQALEKIDQLQKQNAELQYRLGIAEGQLQAYKLPFWKRWFGQR